MDRLLEFLLSLVIPTGTLRVTTSSGRGFTLGDGSGKVVAMRFTSRRAELAVLLDPELCFAEAYMDGSVVVEQGSIADLLALVMAQDYTLPVFWWRLRYLSRRALRRFQQLNLRDRAEKNVAHHYDLDQHLYALFLDADLQYSCGYFETAGQSLDDAQLAKKRHIAAKLIIEPGASALDIGSGWGGLGLYLAETCGASVTGVTLSQEQLAVSRRRAEAKGLAGRADFRFADYRDVTGTFDRVVSVGMFEHVGCGFYDTFFQRCAAVLDPDGIMLLHTIGRSESPGVTSPFIAKYIFPGGYIPALSEVLPAIERAGLLVTDIEILRLHYAETLAAWHQRFRAHRDDAERLYDARFCRMWEFYLASAEMSFRKQNMCVFQIQLTKRQGVVPITRDYIAREEARLRALENSERPPLRLAGE
ncbi:MAG TPA: cyclopropane-fatty-acyl-phospholipid synthase family protein [Xanthobacteraceae bacterium]|nr:cyclopropane-fatty-acyl-phospholipid synthase family protein [Xanthobacteraceae bacterium]